MTVGNWFVLTEAQKNTADQGGSGWGDGEVALGARAVDNETPGLGANLNDNAADYGPLDPVTLAGTWVVPKHMVDDPDYQTYAPDLITYLLTLPWCMLETETIFAPPPPM